jgi:prepilin-type processing-associated H-X9-DG protein/prepilin-type N-terminal cleavage/methylation domain-containing protein
MPCRNRAASLPPTDSRIRAPRRRGFTLVELLVVIGIIALLISILLPALNKAKQQALKVSCAANLRSMGQGMIIYINDTKHYPGHGMVRGGDPYAVWPTRIRASLRQGGRNTFNCPANPDGFKWQKVLGSGSDYADAIDAAFGYEFGELRLNVFDVPFSYGYNDWGAHFAFGGWDGQQKGLGGDLWQAQWKEIKASRVRRSEEMIAIADNVADGAWDFNIDPTTPAEFPGKIHGNGANVLFCDGHVEWFLQKDLTVIDPITKAAYPDAKRRPIERMWNNDNKDTTGK